MITQFIKTCSLTASNVTAGLLGLLLLIGVLVSNSKGDPISCYWNEPCPDLYDCGSFDPSPKGIGHSEGGTVFACKKKNDAITTTCGTGQPNYASDKTTGCGQLFAGGSPKSCTKVWSGDCKNPPTPSATAPCM